MKDDATVLEVNEGDICTIAEHVSVIYPHESCGLLIGREVSGRKEVLKVFPAKNLNRERAQDRYELDPEDFLQADRKAVELDAQIVGIYHSHPDHPCRPSETDRERAWEGYSYLILTVTQTGVTEYRSWVLVGDSFQEETVTNRNSSPKACSIRET